MTHISDIKNSIGQSCFLTWSIFPCSDWLRFRFWGTVKNRSKSILLKVRTSSKKFELTSSHYQCEWRYAYDFFAESLYAPVPQGQLCSNVGEVLATTMPIGRNESKIHLDRNTNHYLLVCDLVYVDIQEMV